MIFITKGYRVIFFCSVSSRAPALCLAVTKLSLCFPQISPAWLLEAMDLPGQNGKEGGVWIQHSTQPQSEAKVIAMAVASLN